MRPVEGRTQSGQPMRATVKEVKSDSVILDMNHPLAGKELDFEIELVERSKINVKIKGLKNMYYQAIVAFETGNVDNNGNPKS